MITDSCFLTRLLRVCVCCDPSSTVVREGFVKNETRKTRGEVSIVPMCHAGVPPRCRAVPRAQFVKAARRNAPHDMASALKTSTHRELRRISTW